MRGGLDDALERLARMDQLRRRAEGGASGDLPTAHGLAEAIEAVRRVVERHPDLNITLYGEQGQGSAEVRIGWEDGVVRAKVVSVEGPDGASFGPAEGPLPVLPAEIPPISELPVPLTEASRPRVDAYPAARPPSPVPEVPRLVDPGRLSSPRPARFQEPLHRAEPTEPAPAPLQEPLRRAARPEAAPARFEEPLRRAAPRAWAAEPEDNGAAARLAAMIREDPSLLASPEER